MLNLDWLISPHDKSIFIEEVWQIKPKVLAAGRPGYFKHLFDKGRLERVIEFSQPSPPSIRIQSVASNEQMEMPFLPSGRIHIDQLRKLYLQGQTVVLNSVENFDPTVAQLARSIETEMGARVQINSYLTPPLSQGLRPHYDTHDVLVLQVQGEKIWKVYNSDSACPLNEMVDGDPKFRESTQSPETIHLKSGDLLYIPRGWIHEALTDQFASLHLTLGIHPPLNKDLLIAAIEAMTDQYPVLRQALPVGPLEPAAQHMRLTKRFMQLIEFFTTHASVTDAAKVIDGGLIRQGRSGGDGHLFEDIEDLRNLTSNTLLERRMNFPCRVVKVDDDVGLQFLNGMIKGPVIFEASMDFVAKRIKPFKVSDLPGLPAKHQIFFASSLVSDGLCQLCRDD